MRTLTYKVITEITKGHIIQTVQYPANKFDELEIYQTFIEDVRKEQRGIMEDNDGKVNRLEVNLELKVSEKRTKK